MFFKLWLILNSVQLYIYRQCTKDVFRTKCCNLISLALGSQQKGGQNPGQQLLNREVKIENTACPERVKMRPEPVFSVKE